MFFTGLCVLKVLSLNILRVKRLFLSSKMITLNVRDFYLFVCLQGIWLFWVMLCSLAFLFLLKMFLLENLKMRSIIIKIAIYILSSVAYQVNLTVTIIFTSFLQFFCYVFINFFVHLMQCHLSGELILFYNV